MLLVTACEDSNSTATVDGLPNTLGESSVGNGKIGAADAYFYDFDNEINVKFNRYDYNTLILGNFDPEKDTLNFRTFPEFVLQLSPDDAGAGWDDPHPIYTVLDTTRIDSVTLSSTQFKNVNWLFWDLDALAASQRYKPPPSDWVYQDSTIVFSDTLDYLMYESVVADLVDEGFMFVDTTETVLSDATYLNPEQFLFTTTFIFSRKVIGSDSLMYRINGDCNQNGIWDPAETIINDNGDGLYNPNGGETYTDLGNGIWDRAEIFHDTNGDGNWGQNEPFEDRNCNKTRDAAEVFTDQNGNNTYDLGEPFVDVGNNQYDLNETFTDLNGNGVGDPGELYRNGDNPNNLLVNYPNYPDLSGHQIILTIYPGDSITTYWGDMYTDLIAEIEFIDTKQRLVDDVDSLVVLRTNQIIDSVAEQYATGEYFITKTEYEYLDLSTSEDVRIYDYHLFKQDDHIYKLIHNSYFKPYGYYFAPDSREDGFWFEDFAVDEVQFYTPNGMLRDGERVVTEEMKVTPIATYRVRKEYTVEADEVTVPAGTFADCFKVTRVTTMTLIGNGVEYIETSIIWLVNGMGIVKDDLNVAWTGIPEFEYSKVELVEFREVPGGSLLRDLFGNSSTLDKLDDLENEEGLDNQPFQVNRTAGFHRVVLPNR